MEEIKGTTLTDEQVATAAGGRTAGLVPYRIVRGDTLTKIAHRFGTTVDALVEINHIKNRNRIYAGDIIYVPGFVD